MKKEKRRKKKHEETILFRNIQREMICSSARLQHFHIERCMDFYLSIFITREREKKMHAHTDTDTFAYLPKLLRARNNDRHKIYSPGSKQRHCAILAKKTPNRSNVGEMAKYTKE